MRIIKICFTLLLVLASGMSLQAKKLRLSYSFENGTVFRYEYIITQDISQEVMGQSQNTHSVTTRIMEFHVIDVNSEGNYMISSKLAGIKARLSSPNGDLEFNSDDIRNGDGVFKLMQWMLNDSVTFVMSPQGEVLNLDSVEELTEEYEGLMANAGPEAQMLAGIGSQFRSKEAIQLSISMFFFKFPKEKVKVGKPWESVSELTQIVPFTNAMTQTVTEVKPGSITLTQQTKIEQADPDVTSLVQGMTMKYNLSGSKEADYEFEADRGLIMRGESRGSISGVMSFESPQLNVPMTIPMTMNKLEKITLLR